MKLQKYILIPLMVFFTSVNVMAAIEQVIQVKGKITDTIGDPIIGANVIVKGTTTGVISDIDGNFEINATKGSTILISFIGYKSQEIKAAETFQQITLESDTEMLDEVVVIG